MHVDFRRWFYSHVDADAGYGSERLPRRRERIDLIIKRRTVVRTHEDLWKRNPYETVALKEKPMSGFCFHLIYNPVVAMADSSLSGYVLWRQWYRVFDTGHGNWQKRPLDEEELMAAVLNGRCVYRNSKALITERMVDEFPLAFKGQVDQR